MPVLYVRSHPGPYASKRPSALMRHFPSSEGLKRMPSSCEFAVTVTWEIWGVSKSTERFCTLMWLLWVMATGSMRPVQRNVLPAPSSVRPSQASMQSAVGWCTGWSWFEM